MSVDSGIIGLPQSGRTTLFNALTGSQAETGKYSREDATRVGVARVPEPRLNVLADILKPKRVVPASVRLTDIGTSLKDLASGAGPLLNELASMDAFLCVIRAFQDDRVPHPLGHVDVARDIANMNLEMTFSDLVLLERRQNKIETSLKAAKAAERLAFQKEQELLAKIRAKLDTDVPIREMSLTGDELKLVSGFGLLSAKPLLAVLNVGEDQLKEGPSMESSVKGSLSPSKWRTIALCAKLEQELAQLPEGDAADMRAAYGLKESGAERTIRESYGLLGLITFFTIASGEVRAWPIAAGTTAVKAAGKIHSDMERGFIRAEVISCADLVKCGGTAEARKRGVLRLEGHDYTVMDGDVVTFLFNV